MAKCNVRELEYDFDNVPNWSDFVKLAKKHAEKASAGKSGDTTPKGILEKVLNSIKPVDMKKRVLENKNDFMNIEVPIVLISGIISDQFISMMSEADYNIENIGDYILIKNAQLFGIKRNILEKKQAEIDKYGMEIKNSNNKQKFYWDWSRKDENSIINYCYSQGFLPENTAIHGYTDKKFGPFSHGYAGYMWALLVPLECKLNSVTDKELSTVDFIIVTNEPRHNDEYGKDNKFNDPFNTKITTETDDDDEEDEQPVKQIEKIYSKKRHQNIDDDDEDDTPVKKKSKKIVVDDDDDEDEDDEVPVKSKKNKIEDEDDDDVPLKKKSKKVVIDDEDDDEDEDDGEVIIKSKKNTIEDDDDDSDDDDEFPKKNAANKKAGNSNARHSGKKVPIDDDDDEDDSESVVQSSKKVKKYVDEDDDDDDEVPVKSKKNKIEDDDDDEDDDIPVKKQNKKPIVDDWDDDDDDDE